MLSDKIDGNGIIMFHKNLHKVSLAGLIIIPQNIVIFAKKGTSRTQIKFNRTHD